ncbi:MAG: dihydropteridine reductase [Clostridia bacterium]|nr:dihydropteridine reductase [Clostridia bacterium]
MNKNDKAFIAEKIRSQYLEREVTELDELKRLDKEVRRPAGIFAYIFGSVGALVLGAGMCLAMGVIGDAVLPGIVIGCAGIAMVSLTYTLYSKLLKSRRARYAPEILALSEEIVNKQ